MKRFILFSLILISSYSGLCAREMTRMDGYPPADKEQFLYMPSKGREFICLAHDMNCAWFNGDEISSDAGPCTCWPVHIDRKKEYSGE